MGDLNTCFFRHQAIHKPRPSKTSRAMAPEGRALLLALLTLLLPSRMHRKMTGSVWAISSTARVNSAWSVLCAALAWHCLRSCWMEWWQGPLSILARASKHTLAFACSLPFVRSIVDREVGKELVAIEKKMHGNGDSQAMVKLPQEAGFNNVLCARYGCEAR